MRKSTDMIPLLETAELLHSINQKLKVVRFVSQVSGFLVMMMMHVVLYMYINILFCYSQRMC